MKKMVIDKYGARELTGKKETVRIDGKLREIVTVTDEKGKILHKAVSPQAIGFHLQDVVQVMIGAAVLSVPVGFTEETWELGNTVPLISIIGFFAMSIFFIGTFTYYSYHHKRAIFHKADFIKRVLSTYFMAFLVVAMILSLIERAPWHADFFLALKRTIIVTLPASMSGAIADLLR